MHYRSFALFALLPACHIAHVTDIPHPMRHGSIQPNVIEDRDPTAERENGLPAGTLSEEASLVDLDEAKACFEVTMRAANTTRVEHETWAWVMYGTPEFEVRDPAYEWASDVETKTMDGRRRVEKKVKKKKCKTNNMGKKECHTEEVTVRDYIPAKVTVSQRKAKLCFNHGGQVSDASRMIGIKYARIEGLWSGFEWNLL